jgi:hypothetical protein
LPVLRWQVGDGECRSLTITNSIKITRDTSKELLARKLTNDVSRSYYKYDIDKGGDVELFLLGRP